MVERKIAAVEQGPREIPIAASTENEQAQIVERERREGVGRQSKGDVAFRPLAEDFRQFAVEIAAAGDGGGVFPRTAGGDLAQFPPIDPCVDAKEFKRSRAAAFAEKLQN